MLINNLIMFFLSLIILIIASYYAVKTILWLAHALKISEFVMAFIIGSLATTLPELFISINGSLLNAGEIVLGNIVGSNIVDISLIAGIIFVFARELKGKKIRTEAIWMFLLGCLPLVLFFIQKSLNVISGTILLISFFIYYIFIFKIKKQFRKILKIEANVRQVFFNTLILILTFLLVYFSSFFVIEYGKLLAYDLKVSPTLIGLFLIAIGTSLPELTLGFQAIRLREPYVALGDLLGAVISNSTFVLGIASLINPITAKLTTMFIASLFFILSSYLFVTFIYSGKKLTAVEGVALILVYVLFVIIELYLK